MHDVSHLSKAIEDQLQSERYEGSRKERKYYLSDSGGCQRMRWLKRHGVDQTFDPHVMWVLKIGELYHEFVYDVWRKQGILVETEETLEDEHFKGRLDSRVLTADKKGQLIADVKSAGEYPMKKVVEDNDVDAGYIDQLLSYIKLNQEVGEYKDIDSGALVFVNKAPGDRAPYISVPKMFRLDNVARKRLQTEQDALVKFWQEDVIPPCTCEGWKKRYKGKYNNFYPFCQATESQIRRALAYLDDPEYSLIALGDRVEVKKGDGTVHKTILSL